MIIIGKISEYKESFPQRSNDHHLVVQAMKEEGWSDDHVSNNFVAFKYYQKLMKACYDWRPLATSASLSHLLVMARAGTGAVS